MIDENTIRPYIIRRYDERYNSRSPAPVEHPSYVVVHGTLHQAEWVANVLANYMAGCDYYYYVEEHEEP